MGHLGKVEDPAQIKLAVMLPAVNGRAVYTLVHQSVSVWPYRYPA